MLRTTVKLRENLLLNLVREIINIYFDEFGVLRYILVNFVILCGIMRNFGNYAEKGQLCGSASAHNSGMPDHLPGSQSLTL